MGEMKERGRDRKRGREEEKDKRDIERGGSLV